MATQKSKSDKITPIIVPTYLEEEKKKKKNILALFKKKNKPVVQEKKEVLLRMTASVLPFLQIYNTHIVMKDGVMEMLQITSLDLQSLNEADLNTLLYADARFYRSYFPDIKTISMNFPSNLEQQRSYWETKMERTEDELKLRYIMRKLYEFDFLEKERTNREYFMFLYAKEVEELVELKKQAIRSLRESFSLKELSVKKKEDVLFILNNQNTKLGGR